MRSDQPTPGPSTRRFVGGSLVLGLGLGGLADGIVLHQILQWHNLVSRRVTNESLEGLRTNLLWDGVFHLTMNVLLVVGLLVLWQARQGRRHATGNLSALIGLVLIGWGVFHVIDQLLFHELLDLHDIREGVAAPAMYNWGFFAIGLVIAAAGWWLLRARGRLGTSAQAASRSGA